MKRPFHAPTSAAIIALLTSGCQTPRPSSPIVMPVVPAIVAQAGEAERNLRSTTLNGTATIPSATSLSEQVPTKGDITLNLPSVDVRVAAKAVLGDTLHTRYVVADRADGKVSLVTPGPVSRAALLALFEKALQAAGLALSSTGDGFLIQPIAQAQAGGTVGVDAFGYGNEVLALQFINASELKKLLDSVLPGVAIAIGESPNSVTIAGTTAQRRNARELIAQFDVNWLRSMSFALYVPQRTDSRLIVPELDKLINAPDAPTRGLVRLISMDRLNGILAVSAQPQYLQDVQRWIDILDREGENNEARLFVYRVQNGRARDLARTLNAAFGGGGATAIRDTDPDAQLPAPIDDPNAPAQRPQNRNAPGLALAAGDADGSAQSTGASTGQGRISADDVNNAVIVYGTPRQYAVVEDALRKLDILPYQVLIEAAITEVTLTDDLRYGVQWNFQTGRANFALGDTPSRGNPAPGSPTFSFFIAPNQSISATLQALEERTNVKVVSAPKLMVLNNQTASLQVGDQVPISTQSATGVQNPDAPIVNSVEYRDTGVILKVTPRVNAGGLVLLDISQEVSNVADRQTSGIDSPTISTRRISTSIAVQDQQVIALGGLFQDSKVYGKDGIPILSRIPLIGGLFGTHVNTQNRTELIVIIKPTVVRTPDDGRAVTEELRGKLRTLEPFRSTGRIP